MFWNEFRIIKSQNVGSLLMKSNQSDFNLRSPSSYLVRSYLIATVNLEKKMKRFFAKNFARNYEKRNNTWNIRRLVVESFVPSAQLTSVLLCRLTDF